MARHRLYHLQRVIIIASSGDALVPIQGNVSSEDTCFVPFIVMASDGLGDYLKILVGAYDIFHWEVRKNVVRNFAV